MEKIKTRMQQLLKALNKGAFEREEAIALSLLSAISGESIFLLGLPGVGKSMIARRLKEAFQNARSFEYLMSRFSTPDEIFGPVSISRLKDEDTYERVVDGYLPTADVIFLDEIWKAGPAIQNSLLTALNERILHNGRQDIRLPLKTIISASNELPAEGEGLEALWDRFLIRYVVEPIRQKVAFLSLLTGFNEECEVEEGLRLDEKEYHRLQAESRKIVIPDTICEIVCGLRDQLSDTRKARESMPSSDNTPYISDRRWRKIMGVLRTSALLNGRTEVDPSDCLLMEHMLWDDDSQRQPVRRIVAETIARYTGDHLPKSMSLEEVERLSIASPVGDLLSLDGQYYAFTAGGEEIRILKSDYDSLKTGARYGEIGPDNVLQLLEDKGSLLVQRPSHDRIVINSITYALKRESPLRSGNTEDLLNAINSDADLLIRRISGMISRNLFLKPVESYPELLEAFDRMKIKRKHFERK